MAVQTFVHRFGDMEWNFQDGKAFLFNPLYCPHPSNHRRPTVNQIFECVLTNTPQGRAEVLAVDSRQNNGQLSVELAAVRPNGPNWTQCHHGWVRDTDAADRICWSIERGMRIYAQVIDIRTTGRELQPHLARGHINWWVGSPNARVPPLYIDSFIDSGIVPDSPLPLGSEMPGWGPNTAGSTSWRFQ